MVSRRPVPGFKLNAPQASEAEESGGFNGVGDDDGQNEDRWEEDLKPPSLPTRPSALLKTGQSPSTQQRQPQQETPKPEAPSNMVSSGVASGALPMKCLIVVGILVIILLIALIITVAVAFGQNDNQNITTTIVQPSGPAPTIPTLPPRVPTRAPVAQPDSRPVNTEPTPTPTTTLGRIYQRGYLQCGVADSQPGFSTINLATGDREGFDVDLCKAVAAAIFGELRDGEDGQSRIEYVPVTSFDRFRKLADGAFDVLVRTTTHTMERELLESATGQSFAFSIPYLYNGLQFGGLDPFLSCADNLNVDSAECADTKICVLDSTTHIPEITAKIPNVQILSVVQNEFLYRNFIRGLCNVIAGEQFDIAESILRDSGYVGNYTYGTNIHSKEPLAMVTRVDDPQWSDFVNWVVQALLASEEETISQRTANFVPLTGVFNEGNEQGIFAAGFRNAISAVGNYGEIYRRNLAALLPRPIPDLINPGDSGVIYSFPFGNIGGTVGGGPFPGGTLETIYNRGFLKCGISRRVIFAQFDGTLQTWDGFDVDFCKAISAALFDGDTDSIVYTDLPASERFQALQSGDVDVLSRLTTVTLSRDAYEPNTEVGFSFSQPNFYDGLTFGGIPPFAGCADRLDVTSISCLDLKICVNQGTTFENRLRALFPSRFILPRQSGELTVEGLVSGDCNVIAGGVVDVSVTSIRQTGYTGDYQTGSGRYSKDPLALVTRQDDNEWSSFVYWIVAAIFYAEEEGITQEAAQARMPAVNLFGPLFFNMFRDAVGAVGNYGEIYERQAQADVPRGGLNEVNRLLSGPQHYALPGVV